MPHLIWFQYLIAYTNAVAPLSPEERRAHFVVITGGKAA
jgi:hypothetical protein